MICQNIGWFLFATLVNAATLLYLVFSARSSLRSWFGKLFKRR